MDKKLLLKATIYGFLIWLVPLVFSFLFYDRERNLVIDVTFFKSIMVVTGSLIGVVLCIKYFRPLSGSYLRHGLTVGMWWLAINLALDAAVLMPMLRVGFADYFMQIGLRYLTMPITTFGIGYLLHQRGKKV